MAPMLIKHELIKEILISSNEYLQNRNSMQNHVPIYTQSKANLMISQHAIIIRGCILKEFHKWAKFETSFFF